MKTVTLDSIVWNESPNKYEGRSKKVTELVIHWWGDPATKPTLSGVVSWFKNPSSQVSAHFVVSSDTVVQMVNMADTAWHAGAANSHTVGIEVDPRVPGNTYETVAALIKFIKKYYPNIVIKTHRDYMATQCPGNLDITQIKKRVAGTWAVATKPVYRVYVGTKQVGAYTVEKNAYNAFVSKNGTKITKDHKDVTDALKKAYAPAPKPTPTKDQEQDKRLDDMNKELSAMRAILNTISEFLASIFKSFKK